MVENEADLRNLLTDVKALCNFLFKIDGKPAVLAPFQEEIVSSLLFKKHNRLIIWCVSQVGKTESVAIGEILIAMFHENEKIINISPTNDQREVISDYVSGHLFDHPWITNRLAQFSNEKRERAFSKMSKRELSFKGNSKIKFLSAESGAVPGEGLLGHSGTVVLVDESPSIDDEIYRTKILRMLGSKNQSLNKMLVDIGTAYKKNHFYDSWMDPDYHKILVNWERAVAEDRMSEKFVEKQREMLTMQEFDIWMNCKLPDSALNQFIPSTWIARAAKNKFSVTGEKYLGVDPATRGSDSAVFLSVSYDGSKYQVYDVYTLDSSTTTEIVGIIKELDSSNQYKKIVIDSTGQGEGVYDMLGEDKFYKHRTHRILFGQRASNDVNRKRMKNLKAEIYFDLRKLFENDLIGIGDNAKLRMQLEKTQLLFSSDGRARIVYKGPGSADELSALALACYSPLKIGASTFWAPLTA